MQAQAQGIRSMFARLARDRADATGVADVAVSIWRAVGSVLSPVIGQPGVAALFKRSIDLTRVLHPCLAPVANSVPDPGALAALRTVLAAQSQPDALSANAALLRNFHDLLTSLIGASLTERLLRPVWDKTFTDAVADDTIS